MRCTPDPPASATTDVSAHHGRPLTAFAVPGRPAADGDPSPHRTSQNRERSERPALHLPPSGCTARPILLRPPPPARALGRPLAALLTVSSTNCGTRSERSEGPTCEPESWSGLPDFTARGCAEFGEIWRIEGRPVAALRVLGQSARVAQGRVSRRTVLMREACNVSVVMDHVTSP